MATSPPVSARSTRSRPRRWAVAGLAATILSTLAVFAPTPTIVSAQDLEVRTERVSLVPRAANRSRDALGDALEASTEGTELRAALAAPGRRTSPVRAGGYHAVGVTLPEAPDEPVLVRGRVDGAWTPWLELPFEPGEAPDVDSPEARSGVHSEPVWMGDADAYELDAPSSVRALDVHLVAPGPSRRRVVIQPAQAGAAGAPSILSRAAWGARAPDQHPSTTGDLKLAIVHHTVNGNSYSSAQVPQLLRSIQAYHQDVQGWNDIAYNFVVDRFGRTWEGRAGGTTNVVVGGHSQGFNTGAVGVVALGDFRSAAAPAATVEAIAKVIAWKFAVHRVNPATTVPFTSAGSAKYPAGTRVTLPRVVAHRDVQATDCPGGRLYSRLGAIRTRVAQLVPEYQKGLDPIALSLDVDGDGLTDAIEYQPGHSGDHLWRSTPAGQPTRRSASVPGTYRPVVGDFDGDGHDDVFWHGTGSAPDPIWWGHAAGGFSPQQSAIAGSYVTASGDFDGDGTDDILWYAPGPAPDYVRYSNSDRTHTTIAIDQDLITAVPLIADIDGDGLDDIFWYGPGSADDSQWISKGRAWTKTVRAVAGWYDPVVLDATGDGRDDILWFAPGSTRSVRWDFAGHTSTTLVTAARNGRPTVGDFDGDGRDDALLYDPGAAGGVIWYSTSTGVAGKVVKVSGRYAVASGQMDAPVPRPTDDVLLLSRAGSDVLWRGNSNRTFRASKVG